MPSDCPEENASEYGGGPEVCDWVPGVLCCPEFEYGELELLSTSDLTSAASRVDMTRLVDPGRELGGGAGESKKVKGKVDELAVYKERAEHPELERTRLDGAGVDVADDDASVRGSAVYSRLCIGFIVVADGGHGLRQEPGWRRTTGGEDGWVEQSRLYPRLQFARSGANSRQQCAATSGYRASAIPARLARTGSARERCHITCYFPIGQNAPCLVSEILFRHLDASQGMPI